MIRRVDPVIVALEENPRPHGCVKFEGSKNEYRIRIGDYRILYQVDDSKKVVTIARVNHRRDSYRKR